MIKRFLIIRLENWLFFGIYSFSYILLLTLFAREPSFEIKEFPREKAVGRLLPDQLGRFRIRFRRRASFEGLGATAKTNLKSPERPQNGEAKDGAPTDFSLGNSLISKRLKSRNHLLFIDKKWTLLYMVTL